MNILAIHCFPFVGLGYRNVHKNLTPAVYKDFVLMDLGS